MKASCRIAMAVVAVALCASASAEPEACRALMAGGVR